MTANFSLKEFTCPCCNKNRISADLLIALQEVRNIFCKSMKITSGYRCEFHNTGIKGSPTSSHILGLAADIAIPDSEYAFGLMKAIMESGQFERVGYGKMGGTLVLHVDIDKHKAYPRLWGY